MKKITMLLAALAVTVCGYAATPKPTSFAEAVSAYDLSPSRTGAWMVLDAIKEVVVAGGDLSAAETFFAALDKSDKTYGKEMAARYQFEKCYTAKDYTKAREYALVARYTYGLYSCDSQLLTAGLIQPALVAGDMQASIAQNIRRMRINEAELSFDLWYTAVQAAELPDAEVKAALVKYQRLFAARAMVITGYQPLCDKVTALLKYY